MQYYDEKRIYHWMVQDFLMKDVGVMPSEAELDRIVTLIEQLERKKVKRPNHSLMAVV